MTLWLIFKQRVSPFHHAERKPAKTFNAETCTYIFQSTMEAVSQTPLFLVPFTGCCGVTTFQGLSVDSPLQGNVEVCGLIVWWDQQGCFLANGTGDYRSRDHSITLTNSQNIRIMFAGRPNIPERFIN